MFAGDLSAAGDQHLRIRAQPSGVSIRQFRCSPDNHLDMEDAVLAPIQSAKSEDYEGGSGFNAAVKPSERTTNETSDPTKTGGASHGMEDPTLTPVQAEPKKCTYTVWLHSAEPPNTPSSASQWDFGYIGLILHL